MIIAKYPLSASLRSAPLPLPEGEEPKLDWRLDNGSDFLAPGQGERWSEGPERGCSERSPGAT
jgi:hypothetical protein